MFGLSGKKISELVVESLVSVGVERVYGVAGDSLNGITEAMHKQKGIKWFATRHEESAAFAAGAEALLTGKLTVCAGSCGPGNLHLINGLYDCQRNNAPVLAIAAHIPSGEIGSGYFQETHPEILFKECSVFCELASTPEQVPRMLGLAMQAAVSKKGVAVIVISGDIALKKIDEDHYLPKLFYSQSKVTPLKAELQEIAALLNEAKTVSLFCGSGCAGAREEIKQFCEKIKAPAVHTFKSKEYLDYDNPYDVGMTGFIGFSSGYFAMNSCEVLLLLGTSFPYRDFYPKKAKIIQIDLDGSQLGRRCTLEKGVVGDVKSTLQALLPLVNEKQDTNYLNTALKHYQKVREGLEKLAQPTKKIIHPQYVAKLVSEHAADDAIFTADVGACCIWAARYLKMNGKRKLLTSFNHGTMANALSQAMGMQAVDKKRQVIAFCGDGGFTMLMGEIVTLLQQQLPIKVIIFNNGALGFVEMEMKAAGFANQQPTTLTNPSFADMTKAIGIHSARVDNPQALEEAIKAALSHEGPAVVDVKTNRFELSMPPTITFKEMFGFSLYMGKSILNGEGSGLIDLAKTNLWR